MDLQGFINTMSEIDSQQRSSYHMTYGDLIRALRLADKDAKFDKRVKGLSSYRGYYIDVALNTDRSGYYATDEEPDYENYEAEKFRLWREKHTIESDAIPTKAHELADVLEKLLGTGFGGYKGGYYEISDNKPLWLAEDSGHCSQLAVIGIDKNLKLKTKVVEP